MGQVKVLAGQTIPDIAVQQCGSVEATFEVAQMNNMSPTDALQQGTMINYPDTVYDTVTFKYYRDNGYKPASDQ